MRERFVLFSLLLLLFLGFSEAATLHGTVYDSSLNMIKNVQLQINTTPKQSHISKNGLYFFYVPVGTYEITAEKYYQKQLIYSASKIVTMEKDGEFNIDIIMESLPGVEVPVDDEDLGPSIITLLRARYGYLIYVVLFVMVALVGTILFFYIRSLLRKKVTHDVSTPTDSLLNTPNSSVSHIPVEKEPESKENFPETLDGVLKIIREEGGRTTQKDIRKKIPLSEAKISLMVSELEAKGKIEKIKKGRGNIIILK